MVRNRAWLVGIVLTVFLTAGCAGAMRSLPRPSARVQGVAVQDLSLSAVTLRWNLRVSNPYTVALPVNRIDYGVRVRGERFLEGTLESGPSVPAGGSASVPVTVRVPYRRVLSRVDSLQPGSVVPYAGDLTLTLQAPVLGAVSVRTRTEGEFPLLAAPGIRLASLDWDELSLRRARAAAVLRMSNPNAFALTVRTFSYRLHLGGHEVAQLGLDGPMNLAAGGSERLRVEVGFSPLAAGSAFLSTLQSRRGSYRLEGTLSARTRFGGLKLPVRRSGTVAFGAGP